MDGSADGDNLVRVNPFGRLFAKELLHFFLDFRDTGRTTHQNHFVDICCSHVGIFQGLDARIHGSSYQGFGKLLKLGSAQVANQVLWSCLRCSDVRQVDFGGCRTGKFNFRFFSCFLQALKRHRILAKIDLLFGLEFRSQPVDDHLVKVISTQVYVTVGGLHFKDPVSKFKDGDIEGSSAQVIDRNLHVYVFLVHAIGKGSSSRLVDDSLYL